MLSALVSLSHRSSMPSAPAPRMPQDSFYRGLEDEEKANLHSRRQRSATPAIWPARPILLVPAGARCALLQEGRACHYPPMQTPQTHTEFGHTSAGYNFDHPDAFDTDAIIACLDDLKVGAATSSLCCAVLCCAVRLIAGWVAQRRLGLRAPQCVAAARLYHCLFRPLLACGQPRRLCFATPPTLPSLSAHPVAISCSPEPAAPWKRATELPLFPALMQAMNAVDVPIYDFKLHQRSEESRRVPPAGARRVWTRRVGGRHVLAWTGLAVTEQQGMQLLPAAAGGACWLWPRPQGHCGHVVLTEARMHLHCGPSPNHLWLRALESLPPNALALYADVIIIEGILVLHIEEIRERLNMKVYVDTDDDVRLARRWGAAGWRRLGGSWGGGWCGRWWRARRAVCDVCGEPLWGLPVLAYLTSYLAWTHGSWPDMRAL